MTSYKNNKKHNKSKPKYHYFYLVKSKLQGAYCIRPIAYALLHTPYCIRPVLYNARRDAIYRVFFDLSHLLNAMNGTNVLLGRYGITITSNRLNPAKTPNPPSIFE